MRHCERSTEMICFACAKHIETLRELNAMLVFREQAMRARANALQAEIAELKKQSK